MSYQSIIGQTSMALDKTRNRVYRSALESVVTPDSVVLDLGAGLGPFGLMAAKLGAKKVYLVEPQALIHTVKNVVKDNNLQDVVECIQGRIENVELPEKVDIITSCFTGNFLLSEDLLPSLFYARDKFLKPGGILLPDSGRMLAVPVNAEQQHANEISYLSSPHLGIDYSFYRKHAANNFRKQRKLLPKNYLSEPNVIHTIDFNTADKADCDVTSEFLISKNSTCHGFLGWFDMTLANLVLSTAPDEPTVHWSPIWYPVDPPIKLKAGETLSLTIKKPSHEPWSWTLKTRSEKRIHSTFIANSNERGDTVSRNTNTGSLDEDGRILLFILRSLNQGQQTDHISNKISANWPKKFHQAAAKKHIEEVAEMYCKHPHKIDSN